MGHARSPVRLFELACGYALDGRQDGSDRGGLSGAKFGPLSGHMTMTARFREKLEWPEKLSTRGESTPTFAPRIGFGDDGDGD